MINNSLMLGDYLGSLPEGPQGRPMMAPTPWTQDGPPGVTPTPWTQDGGPEGRQGSPMGQPQMPMPLAHHHPLMTMGLGGSLLGSLMGGQNDLGSLLQLFGHGQSPGQPGQPFVGSPQNWFGPPSASAGMATAPMWQPSGQLMQPGRPAGAMMTFPMSQGGQPGGGGTPSGWW